MSTNRKLTSLVKETPWWWPVRADKNWMQRIRDDYPEATGLDDDEIAEKYADGWPFADTWDHLGDAREEYQPVAEELLALYAHRRLRTLENYHDDDGCVLWWKLPIDEPPYVGTPLDTDWPGYHTHWTPILMPDWQPDE